MNKNQVKEPTQLAYICADLSEEEIRDLALLEAKKQYIGTNTDILEIYLKAKERIYGEKAKCNSIIKKWENSDNRYDFDDFDKEELDYPTHSK